MERHLAFREPDPQQGEQRLHHENPRTPSLGVQLREWARTYAHRTALVASGMRITYAQLDRNVDRLAAGLHHKGIARGDRVMVQLPNSPGFVTACFALFRLGAVPVLAMPMQRFADIDALCALAEPVAYLIPDRIREFDFRPLAAEIVNRHASLRHVFVDGEPGCFQALSALSGEPPEWPEPPPGETALLLLSGGSTGIPKLIPRTHGDYTYNFRASAELCKVGAESVYLAVLPVAHNFALACPGILGVLSQGGTVVLAETASCDECMPMIERERVTHVALVPPLAQLWAQARDWEDSDLSSLRLVQVGGSRLAPQLAKDLVEKLGWPLQQVFGMAEGLLCYTRLDDPVETILHTQGRPLSPLDETRIVDETGREVPDGATGELLTRGPYTIRGYYRAGEHNRRAFTSEGFYRTGDLVRRTPEGNLVVAGRIKEQIQRSGEKVAATEIEDALRACAGVQGATVVAIPDALLGERIGAFLLGATSLSAATIRAELARNGLAPGKLPDQIEWIAHWPQTAVGKIDKQRLVAIALERAAENGSAASAGRPPAAQFPRAAHAYKEQWVNIAAAPLEMAVRIIETTGATHYTVYERAGEWSIGLGAACVLEIGSRGKLRFSEAGANQTDRPCPAIAAHLNRAPFQRWRAYGYAAFEFSYLLHDLEPGPGERPLLKLTIPETEIRLRAGQALIRCQDAARLARMSEHLRALDQERIVIPSGISLSIGETAEARADYESQVAAVVAEMQAGQYEKMILSRTVNAPLSLDIPLSYYTGRCANTPARSFVLRDGDFHAYGFSPETVLEVDSNGCASTQPLAGTRALIDSPAADERLGRELLQDAKEIAEHAVSVKLAMSEMTEVCSPDSTRITQFMSVCRRGSVQHLASRVCGRLANGYTAWHAFERLFPAVTASGIPKRGALQSIRRFEAQPRGLYSGSVLMVDSDGAMDAALVLRSGYRQGERCWLQAGAGLVALSKPAREWEETCEKLASVARFLRARA